LKLEYKVTEDAAGQRLDKFLRKRLADVPLSHLYKLVRTKKVRVNGTRADIARLLQEGDIVVVHAAQARPEGPAPERPASVVRQDFAVLYEDAHILVCDKPAGLPVHTGTGITGDTLVDQARAYLERQGLEVAEGEFKPSPAHRIDRETSGVVVVAKTRQAMVRLTEIFTAGEAKKTYPPSRRGGSSRTGERSTSASPSTSRPSRASRCAA
jgi:23S rRNA pseudouridine955/2504/2580 synthase